MAAEHVPQWEIIDYAADDKPDVPSGTARELAETLANVRAPEVTVPIADLHGPVEARGADVSGTRIHSLRLPSFVVTTEVVFAGPGERLVMRHDPGLTASRMSAARSWPFVGSATRWAFSRVGLAPVLRIRHDRASPGECLGRHRRQSIEMRQRSLAAD